MDVVPPMIKWDILFGRFCLLVHWLENLGGFDMLVQTAVSI